MALKSIGKRSDGFRRVQPHRADFAGFYRIKPRVRAKEPVAPTVVHDFGVVRGVTVHAGDRLDHTGSFDKSLRQKAGKTGMLRIRGNRYLLFLRGDLAKQLNRLQLARLQYVKLFEARGNKAPSFKKAEDELLIGFSRIR